MTNDEKHEERGPTAEECFRAAFDILNVSAVGSTEHQQVYTERGRWLIELGALIQKNDRIWAGHDE